MTSPPDDREAAKAAELAATERQVKRAVEMRARERQMKDELQHSLYRQKLDGELQRLHGGESPRRWRSAGLVTIGGFAAFLVVIWLLGPADLSFGTYALIAAGAALGLGFVSLLIVAAFDRLVGRNVGPVDPVLEKPAERSKG